MTSAKVSWRTDSSYLASFEFSWLLALCVSTLNAQNLLGDYLCHVSRSGTSNLLTVHVREPLTGFPQLVDIQTVSMPYGDCNSNPGSNCNQGTYRDREGFLWIVDRQYYVLKTVPPPIPIASRLVFAVDLLNGPAGNLGRPQPPMVFDTNGDALIVTHAQYASYIVRIDHSTGAASVLAQSRPNPVLGIGDLAVLFDGQRRRIFYFEEYQLHRLTPTANQWVNEILPPSYYWGQLQEAPGNRLLATSYSSPNHYDIQVIDPDSGSVISSYSHPDQGRTILVVPTATLAEVWSIVPGSVYSYLHRVVLQPDSTFANGITLSPSPIYNSTFGSGLIIDGYGRLYVGGGDGNLYYTDASRSRVEGFVTASGYTPYGAEGGVDPMGMRRAMSVDKFLDEDGDGVSNLDELRAGSHPFDPSITPSANPPTLFVTPSAMVGQTVTLVLGGYGGSAFMLATGVASSSPLSLPGLVGRLQLAPNGINVFLATSPLFPIALPTSGRFLLSVGVPNNTALSGVEIPFQGMTWSNNVTRTGFTNLQTLHIL